MDFKNLLIDECPFWEMMRKAALSEGRLFDCGLFLRHVKNHIYHGGHPEKYKYDVRYRCPDGMRRYWLPPGFDCSNGAVYFEMAKSFMDDTTDATITGFVDFYFARPLSDRPVYIKQRPCKIEALSKLRHEYRFVALPHDEYVAYQISDDGERKILSYGLVDKPLWEPVIQSDFRDGKPIEELPESELEKR